MGRVVRYALIFCLPVAVVFTVLVLFARTASSEPADVDEMIADIRSDSSEQARWSKAQDLSLRVTQIFDEGQSETISEGTIAALVGLLQDHSEAGDFWIVGALGSIGPRADIAVPVLKGLHPKACAEARAPGFHSGIPYVYVIEVALEGIVGSAPDCLGLRNLKS